MEREVVNHYKDLKEQQSHRYRVYYHKERILNTATGKCARIPISIEIHPTNNCNSDCDFCAYDKSHNQEFISESCFNNLIQQVVDLRGVCSVVFSGGGEPTLNPFLPKAIDLLSKNNIDVGIITNGICLSEQLYNSYLKCSWIRVSLNGFDVYSYNKITGLPNNAFYNVCENIKKISHLKRINPSLVVGVSCVVDRHYSDSSNLVSFIKLANELQVDYVMYRPYEGDTNNDTEITRNEFENIAEIINCLSTKLRIVTNIDTFIKEKYKRHFNISSQFCPLCDLGLILVISADGNIHPCINSVKEKCNTKYNINSARIIDYLNDISINYSLCSDCRYRHMNEEIQKGFPKGEKFINGKDIHWKFL